MRLAQLAFALLYCLVAERHSQAQAWVPETGTVSTGVTYQYDWSDTIVEAGGDIELVGDSVAVHSVILDADFSPWQNVGVSVQVPVLLSQYTGDGVLLSPHGVDDDGNLHTSLQDLRVATRLTLLNEPLVVTPSIGVSLPLSDYPVQGFTAPGRGLKKLHFGVDMARSFDPWLPRLFAHASAEFSWVERLDAFPEAKQISQNYSHASVQLGYVLTDKIVGMLLFDTLVHHDGVHFVDWEMLSPQVRDYHDSLLKERTISVGVGAGYQLSDEISGSLAAQSFVSGDNTRAAHVVAFNLSWDLALWHEAVSASEQ